MGSDWNHDGHIDVMANYDGEVYLILGPEWKEKISVYRFTEADGKRAPKSSSIHCTMLDVDGDKDLDFIGSNSAIDAGCLFW